jgi:hypothetical protein
MLICQNRHKCGDKACRHGKLHGGHMCTQVNGCKDYPGGNFRCVEQTIYDIMEDCINDTEKGQDSCGIHV